MIILPFLFGLYFWIDAWRESGSEMWQSAILMILHRCAGSAFVVSGLLYLKMIAAPYKGQSRAGYTSMRTCEHFDTEEVQEIVVPNPDLRVPSAARPDGIALLNDDLPPQPV